jgi:8-oxo-dGTP pyrophosphatase MutT (NUDIX family)
MRKSKIIHTNEFLGTQNRRRFTADAERSIHAPSAKALTLYPPLRAGIPLFGSSAAATNPQLQSGVLAFRRLPDDKPEVLLIRKNHSKNWGIPKGKVKANLSPAENAAKEAFEEAGIKGTMHPLPIGTYRAVKRVHDLKIVIEVSVYLLEVTSIAKKWPEKKNRDVKWCSPLEAVELLHEPILVELCEGLFGI